MISSGAAARARPAATLSSSIGLGMIGIAIVAFRQSSRLRSSSALPRLPARGSQGAISGSRPVSSSAPSARPCQDRRKSQQHTPDEVCIDSFQSTELRTTVIAPLRLVSCSPISTARSITTGGPRPCRTLSIIISAAKKELVQYLRSSLPDRGTLTRHSEAHAWIGPMPSSPAGPRRCRDLGARYRAIQSAERLSGGAR
jgi:hypothetical protein